jgi:hypothetical protein
MSLDKNEAQYLIKLQEQVAKTREFFRPVMKSERERSVCRAFLRCLGINFSEEEIIVSTTEPIDVRFRSANFQIRELLDPGRKRGDELKETQGKYEKATSIEDLSTPYKPSRPCCLKQSVTKVTQALQEKAEKYGKGCQELDALVYVDLQDQHLDVKSQFPNVTPLKAQGWRSASVIFAPSSVILFANPDAPVFLLNHAGQVQLCANKWDTLFEA